VNTPLPTIIALIGPMGAGKTTIGKAVARQLGYEFIDTDHEIQQKSGVSIATIFEIEGEAGFRKRETQALRDILEHQHIVLATGGGAILAAENRELLKRHAKIIYLQVSDDVLWKRLQGDKHRPLLKTENPFAKMQEIYHARHPLYLETAHAVLTIGNVQESIYQTAQHIMSWLEHRPNTNITQL
jgi:shikimate kinase